MLLSTDPDLNTHAGTFSLLFIDFVFAETITV